MRYFRAHFYSMQKKVISIHQAVSDIVVRPPLDLTDYMIALVKGRHISSFVFADERSTIHVKSIKLNAAATISTPETPGTSLNNEFPAHRISVNTLPSGKIVTLYLPPGSLDPVAEAEFISSILSPVNLSLQDGSEAAKAFVQKDNSRFPISASDLRISPTLSPLREYNAETCTLTFRSAIGDNLIPAVSALLAKIEPDAVVLSGTRHPAGGVLNGEADHVYQIRFSKELSADQLETLGTEINSLLILPLIVFINPFMEGKITFEEAVFSTTFSRLLHQYIATDNGAFAAIKEALVAASASGNKSASDTLSGLGELRYQQQRNVFTADVIQNAFLNNPVIVKMLYNRFAEKFTAQLPSVDAFSKAVTEDKAKAGSRLGSPSQGVERSIFEVAFDSILKMNKTNFYQSDKRSFAFSMSGSVLDAVQFPKCPERIRFYVGVYATASHLVMGDISRGGVRLLAKSDQDEVTKTGRMTETNYLLASSQERKHQGGIGENGSKAVITPYSSHIQLGRPQFGQQLRAMLDFVSGELDLLMPIEGTPDYTGKAEITFLGPDEYTANLMDVVAQYAKVRNWPYWGTFTTGKSAVLGGIAHDTYGVLNDGQVFGITARLNRDHPEYVLSIGTSVSILGSAAEVLAKLDGRMELSGMTTTSVLSAYRMILDHEDRREEDERLFMAGGPDGDLGSNNIQSFKGATVGISDSAGVLYNPAGLSRDRLAVLALDRLSPRKTSAHYDISDGSIFVPRRNRTPRPEEIMALGLDRRTVDAVIGKLKETGFIDSIGRLSSAFNDQDTSPVAAVLDGVTPTDRISAICSYLSRIVRDDMFCDTIYTNPMLNKTLGVTSFIPNGGLPNVINNTNVEAFKAAFGMENIDKPLIIVEGANIFFTPAARAALASDALFVRDVQANKGGVMSSALGEVLPALLLTPEELMAHLAQSSDVVPELRVRLIKETQQFIKWNEMLTIRTFFDESKRSGQTLLAVSDKFTDCILDIVRSLSGSDSASLQVRTPEVQKVILSLIVPNCLQEFLEKQDDKSPIDAAYDRLSGKDFLRAYRDVQVIQKIATLFVYIFGTTEPFNLEKLMDFLKTQQMDSLETLFLKLDR